MIRRMIAIGLVLISLVMLFTFSGRAEEVEHDRCSCKLAMKGAESTLKGGTCVRTEYSTCLMEWSGGSATKVSQGNGLSQTDAAAKAQAEFTRANDVRLEIPRLAPAEEDATPLQLAMANLSRVPPEAYGRPGMPESFVLAAGTALIRFQKGPLNFLAATLLRSQRDKLIAALQTESDFKVEQYVIRGNTGCLQIEDLTQGLRVYVKTPFANPERC